MDDVCYAYIDEYVDTYNVYSSLVWAPWGMHACEHFEVRSQLYWSSGALPSYLWDELACRKEGCPACGPAGAG